MDDLQVLLEQMGLVRETLNQVTGKDLHEVTITEGMGYLYGLIASQQVPAKNNADDGVNAADFIATIPETPAQPING